jgi:hypothetical protein
MLAKANSSTNPFSEEHEPLAFEAYLDNIIDSKYLRLKKGQLYDQIYESILGEKAANEKKVNAPLDSLRDPLATSGVQPTTQRPQSSFNAAHRPPATYFFFLYAPLNLTDIDKRTNQRLINLRVGRDRTASAIVHYPPADKHVHVTKDIMWIEMPSFSKQRVVHFRTSPGQSSNNATMHLMEPLATSFVPDLFSFAPCLLIHDIPQALGYHVLRLTIEFHLSQLLHLNSDNTDISVEPFEVVIRPSHLNTAIRVGAIYYSQDATLEQIQNLQQLWQGSRLFSFSQFGDKYNDFEEYSEGSMLVNFVRTGMMSDVTYNPPQTHSEARTVYKTAIPKLGRPMTSIIAELGAAGLRALGDDATCGLIHLSANARFIYITIYPDESRDIVCPLAINLSVNLYRVTYVFETALDFDTNRQIRVPHDLQPRTQASIPAFTARTSGGGPRDTPQAISTKPIGQTTTQRPITEPLIEEVTNLRQDLTLLSQAVFATQTKQDHINAELRGDINFLGSLDNWRMKLKTIANDSYAPNSSSLVNQAKTAQQQQRLSIENTAGWTEQIQDTPPLRTSKRQRTFKNEEAATTSPPTPLQPAPSATKADLASEEDTTYEAWFEDFQPSAPQTNSQLQEDTQPIEFTLQECQAANFKQGVEFLVMAAGLSAPYNSVCLEPPLESDIWNSFYRATAIGIRPRLDNLANSTAIRIALSGMSVITERIPAWVQKHVRRYLPANGTIITPQHVLDFKQRHNIAPSPGKTKTIARTSAKKLPSQSVETLNPISTLQKSNLSTLVATTNRSRESNASLSSSNEKN